MKIYDVWAEWCAPCKRFGPIFSRVSYDFPDIEFIKMNADEEPEFLNQYKINSIPTILIVDDSGNLLFQHAGILSETAFRQVIVDMRTWDNANTSSTIVNEWQGLI